MSSLNPFDRANYEIPFDLNKFLEIDHSKVEILFKEFFQSQVNNNLNDIKVKSNISCYKYYVVHRSPASPLEIIQAYCRSQAVYLHLLNQFSHHQHKYPFIECLKYCAEIGKLTPYDIYTLSVDSLFDTDNDTYLIEVDNIIMIQP